METASLHGRLRPEPCWTTPQTATSTSSCGRGAASMDAQRYVDNMELLVSEYPAVTFVFMTGHAQGRGENLYDDPQSNGDGHVHYNNELIRQHCIDNERLLFDFADIGRMIQMVITSGIEPCLIP